MTLKLVNPTLLVPEEMKELLESCFEPDETAKKQMYVDFAKFLKDRDADEGLALIEALDELKGLTNTNQKNKGGMFGFIYNLCKVFLLFREADRRGVYWIGGE